MQLHWLLYCVWSSQGEFGWALAGSLRWSRASWQEAADCEPEASTVTPAPEKTQRNFSLGWLQIWDLIWSNQIQDLIQDYLAEADTVALSLGKTAGKCNQCKVTPKIWWYRVTGGLIDRALLRCTQRVLCARWIIMAVLTTYSHSLSLAGDFQSNVRKIKDKGYQWVAQSNGLRKRLFENMDRWSIE